MSEKIEPHLPILIAVPFPIFFLALWLGVVSLIGSLSGWFALQKRYPAGGEPALLTLRMQSGRMGMGVRLNGVLTLSACRSGLRVGIWKLFGPFQKPFLVPWSQIGVEPRKVFFMSVVTLRFGNPEVGKLTIDARTWEKLVSQPREG